MLKPLHKTAFLAIAMLLSGLSSQAQYNTLWIPETLSGTTFNLALRDTFAQIEIGRAHV